MITDTKEKKRVKWIEYYDSPLYVKILAIRLTKTKAFISVEKCGGCFTITTTKESAKRLMKS